MLYLAVTGQVSPPPGGLDFTQLGIASIVCVLLLAWGLSQRQEVKRLQGVNQALGEECSKLQEDRVLRERELGDRVVPMLTQAVDVLGKIAPQLSIEKQQMTDIVRRLESAIDHLNSR